MSTLFSSLTIQEITLRNRIAVSPMCMYTATDGFASDWHLVHYGSRAVGGAGLVIQEATAVSPEGRITPGDLGIYSDGHVEKLRAIAGFIRQQGSVAGIQLAHAGRKAGCARPWEGGKQLKPDQGGWQPVAPSSIPFNPDDAAPAELDAAGIAKVTGDFTAAARRAAEAGYQLAEIHAAHGYLVHQFLSPLSNRRTDQYGGSFGNRTRLLREIVTGIRSVWPHNLPLFVRLSATDWVDGGWGPEETVQLAALLKNLGVDLVDCSSGGMVPDAKIPVGPGFQVPFAERIRKETGILTGAVGFITEAEQAENILEKGAADLVVMGRELLRNPYFPFHAAQKLGEDISPPLQYLRGKERVQ